MIDIRQEHKYIEVAERIEALIEKQILKVGDRLPSVRALSKEQGISMSTAFQAYYSLESKGLIEARPQSGYYVKYSPEHILDLPKVCDPIDDAVPVSVDEMINSVYYDLRSTKLINFSMAAPSFELLPIAKLNKAVTHVLRESKPVVQIMSMCREVRRFESRLRGKPSTGADDCMKTTLL